jgi:hypothetical protein
VPGSQLIVLRFFAKQDMPRLQGRGIFVGAPVNDSGNSNWQTVTVIAEFRHTAVRWVVTGQIVTGIVNGGREIFDPRSFFAN